MTRREFNDALLGKVLAARERTRYSPPMPTPPSLGERAEADLAFVRTVLARSHHFSAVPGLGGVLMGATALATAGLSTHIVSREQWLGLWIAEAGVAMAIGLVTLMQKARRSGQPLSASPARRFALGLVPPIFAGALLTTAAVRAGAWELLAPIWLCCYGIGVLGAGAVSAVPVVPALGAAFLCVGALAVATPAAWATGWLALAFGGFHLIAGAIVMRRHGG